MSYIDTINNFNNKNILVIGDLVLDRYIQGSVSRISPEAPVPVVLQEKFFTMPGGASNVANNLRSLGAQVTLVGRIGDDPEGQTLKDDLIKRDIHTEGIFVDPSIPTSTKTRVMAQHQQVVRVDRENNKNPIDPDLIEKIKLFIFDRFGDFDAVIISDYGKGMIVPDLVAKLCQLALKNNKIITVDPKVEHFAYYQNVTAITPNKNEAQNAIRNIKVNHADRNLSISTDKLDSDENINAAGRGLIEFLGLESLLITLGEDGMCLFEKEEANPYRIQTRAQEVYDVSGAGDAVIAVFTLSLTAGATKKESANLANHAAGIVVAKLGAATVTKEELLAVLDQEDEMCEVGA